MNDNNNYKKIQKVFYFLNTFLTSKKIKLKSL